MRLFPERDRLIIEVLRRAETIRGIALPQNLADNERYPAFGRVVAVGPRVKDYMPGNIVFLRKFDGMRFELEPGKEVILAREFEVSGLADLSEEDGYILSQEE